MPAALIVSMRRSTSNSTIKVCASTRTPSLRKSMSCSIRTLHNSCESPTLSSLSPAQRRWHEYGENGRGKDGSGER